MTSAIASLVAQNAAPVAAVAAEKKAAAKRPAAVKKASTKPASKAKTAASTKAAPQVIKYRVVVNRPSSGPMLWAHTAAWLELSGMLGGKSFSKKAAQNVAGNTAIAYHLQKGTFEQNGDKIKLTPQGRLHFKTLDAEGKIDADTKAAFAAILKGGKPDGEIIKNKNAIGAMPE